MDYECDTCGEEFTIYTDPLNLRYCPHCGSKGLKSLSEDDLDYDGDEL